MSDFESRLRDTLVRGAADAPVDVDLAGGARRRLRRRRTTSLAVAAVAAVAVGGPIVALQLGDSPSSDPSRGEIATQPPAPDAASEGWRAESWHHVTFEVPLDWGLGGTTAWCTQADDPAAVTPSVSRPLDVVPAIACSPLQGYGLAVGPSAGVLPVEESGAIWQYDAGEADEPYYPDGAWLGMWYDDGVAVTVVTPERATTERIMASIEEIDGRDPYGCPPDLGAAEAATGDGSESVSVCRYDEEDLLSASRRLGSDESEEFRAALEAAPFRETPRECPTPPGPVPRTVVLEGGAYAATIDEVHCEAIYLSGATRELTDEIRRFLYPFPGLPR